MYKEGEYDDNTWIRWQWKWLYDDLLMICILFSVERMKPSPESEGTSRSRSCSLPSLSEPVRSRSALTQSRCKSDFTHVGRIHMPIWECHRLILTIHDLSTDPADNGRIDMMGHGNLMSQDFHSLSTSRAIDVSNGRLRMLVQI